MKNALPAFLLAWALVATIAFTVAPVEPACVIQLDKQNVLVIGIDNLVSILVSGVPEELVRVQVSDNLRIKKETGNQYTIRASTPGEGWIKVEGGKLPPQTFRYRIKRIPDPVLRLGARYTSGHIATPVFRAQKGIAWQFYYFDVEVLCSIMAFSVTQTRNSEVVASASNTGARFTPAVQAMVEKARPGDIFYFDNFKMKCSGDAAARQLSGLTFVLE